MPEGRLETSFSTWVRMASVELYLARGRLCSATRGGQPLSHSRYVVELVVVECLGQIHVPAHAGILGILQVVVDHAIGDQGANGDSDSCGESKAKNQDMLQPPAREGRKELLIALLPPWIGRSNGVQYRSTASQTQAGGEALSSLVLLRSPAEGSAGRMMGLIDSPRWMHRITSASMGAMESTLTFVCGCRFSGGTLMLLLTTNSLISCISASRSIAEGSSTGWVTQKYISGRAPWSSKSSPV